MANIEMSVNNVAKKANDIASLANDMQKSVQQAYNLMSKMKSFWKDGNYNSLVTVASKAGEFLSNQAFKRAVSTLPHELYSKAKSTAQTSNVECNVSFTDYTVIILPKLDTVVPEVVYQGDVIKQYKSDIDKAFSQAAQYADRAIEICNNLKSDWKSTSGAESTRRNLISAFNQVKLKTSDIGKAMANLMESSDLAIKASISV